MTNNTFAQKVKNEANKELMEDNIKKFKEQYKRHLKRIEDTKVILKNLERELVEFEHEMNDI